MKKYILPFLITACATVQTLHANATEPATPTTTAESSDSDDWAAQQKEAASLKTKAEIAKYRAEIARYEADARNAGVHGSPVLNSPLPVQGSTAPVSVLPPVMPIVTHATARPSLVRIGAVDGHYEARVELNGNTFDVRSGDTLDGGWKVVSIDAAGVQVRLGKQQAFVLR